ncbi:MAG: 2-oxo acid dehydrogenase subunit E2 [Anaerolineae bacterium]|jgi:pyruvate dehydrogenase E2 component (dihydrolipoamide acetyltransferase)|nr:2-oxo acid dehydrogenase subunit E2 [Anaerolineae bacterium]MDH7473756.1 2-oxo acid dehydrogenase subunit E2 [Anaerolineae bacterium]
MAAKIIMPKLGMAMSEGIVAKWNKGDGDPVEKGEEIAVIMSKKITYKLTAPESGILRIVVREKETRPVGATLAFITAPGEAIPEVEQVAGLPPGVAVTTIAAPAPASTAAAPAPTGFVPASPAARRLAKEKGIDLAQVKGTGADGMVTEADVMRFVEEGARAAEPLATSAARRLAEQRGLKLAEIPGTGIGGRITEQDVLAFEARAQAPVPAAPPGAARVVPFVGMRQAIAEHMVESLHSMAQLTMMMEVDVTELVKLREQIKADFEVTYTDLLVRAVAKTLKNHPRLNATLIGDEIHQLESIHIGVAVALPDGLIVPVVRDADRRTLQEIAQEVRRLAQGARDGTLTVDEVTGSTFTITNLGSYGVDGFTPIINAPEAAILGVGRIAERVVVYDDQIARRKMMVLSLTIDHRLVDGAPGAEFMRSLKELLENPYRLLV